MLTIKSWLFIALGGFTAFYLITWLSAIRRKPAGEPIAPGPIHAGIGFVANFFDTLGIGSFATTTSFFRFLKLVKDEVIPGTLNVGHTLPTITQAFIYIAILRVEMTTLILLIVASVLGMWLGAGITTKWPRRKIQIGMGIALLMAASFLLYKIFSQDAASFKVTEQVLTSLKTEGIPDDVLEKLQSVKNQQVNDKEQFLALLKTTVGDEQAVKFESLILEYAREGPVGLHGLKLWIGVAGNFILGALMSLGIGLYGPCLIMITLLGMNPKAAFPIMMGSCAFLMPVGSAQFIRKGSYNLRAALGLALGGIPAVLIAAYIVKELDLKYVMWLVVVVVVYTAISMLRSAMVERQAVVAKQEA
jgi:uncharacterized membrane protein YfcA